MMDWQPIETYDALPAKKLPKFAVFYVKASPGRNGGYGLCELVVTQRNFGSRVVTLWMPLPEPPK